MALKRIYKEIICSQSKEAFIYIRTAFNVVNCFKQKQTKPRVLGNGGKEAIQVLKMSI